MKTIKEIAELANVSPGTVDRVLHNRGGVSGNTRERVLKIMEQYNYERNMIASTLAMKKKFTIAALVPSAELESDFWFKPHQGIQEAYKTIKDYGLTVNTYQFNQFEQHSFREAFERMINDRPDGVIMTPLFQEQNKMLCQKLDRLKIPFLFVNIDIEGMNNISYIGQDSIQAGTLAGKLMHLLNVENQPVLIVRKYRKIKEHFAIEGRIKGFINYFEQYAPNVEIHRLELSGGEKSHLEKLTKTLLKNHQIANIFVPSSFVNIIADYLKEYELKEIKLIGFDIYPESEMLLKSGIIDFLITQKSFDQGFRAVRTMSDYLLFGIQPKQKQFAPIKIITSENVDFHEWDDY